MAMEDQRRRKLIRLIKDLALTETTKKTRVPAAISDYILGEYAVNFSTNAKDQQEDTSDFEFKLEEIIKERYKQCKVKEDGDDKMNLKHFMKSCDAFATAKSEYIQIALNLNSLLHDIIQLKEKYSVHLMEKSLAKQGEVEILEKKLHFLKLQSFLKLYSENNALDAHLQLKEILTERLKNLQSQNDNLHDLTKKYSELKANKTYSELLQIYKQLLKREIKIDYMIED